MLGSQNWDLYVTKTQYEISKQSIEIRYNSANGPYGAILKLYF